MVQSVLDRYLRTAKSCCYCLDLKNGTIVIAILGFLAGVYYTLFFACGKDALKHLGESGADLVLHIQAIVGVLLCATHAMLLVAATIYQEVIILMYLWFIIAYLIVQLPLVLYISVSTFFTEAVFPVVLWVILPSIMCLSFFILIVIPVVNGFRRNIHTVVLILG